MSDAKQIKSYEQWHDDDMTFHRRSKLFFSQCNPNRTIKTSQLMTLCSDSAIEDYFFRGLTWDFLAAHGVAILTSRASYKVHQVPKANEEVLIHTWEEKPQGLQLRRRYEIVNEKNEPLISGLSTWLVADVNTHRIIKPSLFTLRPEPTVFTEPDCPDCGKITFDVPLLPLEDRRVRLSDIDSNGHVNNTRYGDYIDDCLPPELRLVPIKTIKINYSKEAMLDQVLSIFGNFDKNDVAAVVAGESRSFKISAKVNGETCFEAVIGF